MAELASGAVLPPLAFADELVINILAGSLQGFDVSVPLRPAASCRRHARYPLGPNIGRNLSYRARAAGCFSISSAVFFMNMLPDSFSVSAWK